MMCPWLYAGMTTVVREYSYRAGANDSRTTARAEALRQMKLEWLQEDIGMLMQSFTQVSGSEQGRTITQNFSRRMEAHAVGVVRVREISSEWDGETFWIRAELSADMGQIQNDLDNLRREMQAELLAYRQSSRGAADRQISEPRLTAKGFRVYEDGVLLHENDVRAMMSSNPRALNLYREGMNDRSARGRMTFGIVSFGISASYWTVRVIANPTFEDSRGNRWIESGWYWGDLMIGGLFGVYGVIFTPWGASNTRRGQRNIQHSVNMYNRGQPNVQTKNSNIELHFGVTQNGLGLVLNF